MKETQQVTNNGYGNWLWNYGKQAIKGLTVMGVGMLGYVGLRGYWGKQFIADTESSEKTALIPAATKIHTAGQNPSTSHTVTSTNKPTVWESTGETIAYRKKRSLLPLSDDFIVNKVVNDTQQEPAIASLNNGEFVISWTSAQQNGSGNDIFARRFSSNSFPIMPLGEPFLVNNYTLGNQQESAITALSNGNFVICWTSAGQDGWGRGIFAQIFAANGTKLNSEFQVNTNTSYDQYNADIVSLPNDNFLITWTSTGKYGIGEIVCGQLFNANGTRLGEEFQVNTYTQFEQSTPSIASLNDGGFVITWQSYNQDSSGYGVYAQRFSNSAIKISGEFQVNTYTLSIQAAPAITGLPNGEFVIVWEGEGPEDNSGIYAQRFSTNGTKLDNQFLVNDYTAGLQNMADIATVGRGEFVITWSGVGADDTGVYAKRFSANALPIGTQFRVNNFIPNNQGSSVIASLGRNEFVIAWKGFGAEDDSGIYARWFIISYSSSLFRNQILIDQGQTILLSQNELLAVSENNLTSNLTLIPQNTTNGFFASTDNPSLPIFNFTQSDVNNGKIQFSHSDSYEAPSYKIAIDNGDTITISDPVTVEFNRKPLWLKQQITIANRRTVLLSENELLAIGDRNRSQVFFEVRNTSHGMFTLVNANYAINNFTQQQVNASAIKFVHDGSNLAPSFEIRANDGRLYTAYQSGQINFTFNRPPVLTRNKANITQGERHILNIDELAATDLDELTESDMGQLLFNFTTIQHGFFSLSTNPNTVITSAYQNQLAAGQLLFQHDGSETSPSYNVSVTDGVVSTESQMADITFTMSSLSPNVNSNPNLNSSAGSGATSNNPQSETIRDNTNASIGGAIGGVGGAVLLAGAGIFAANRYRRNKALTEQRSKNPLANAMYNELQISGTEDFQSEKGLEFINAVEALNNELIRVGSDIKQMTSEEIKELASDLANAAKAQLGKKINPLDLQECAQKIVSSTMTSLHRENIANKDAIVEMDTMASRLKHA